MNFFFLRKWFRRIISYFMYLKFIRNQSWAFDTFLLCSIFPYCDTLNATTRYLIFYIDTLQIQALKDNTILYLHMYQSMMRKRIRGNNFYTAPASAPKTCIFSKGYCTRFSTLGFFITQSHLGT
jgi:hypothetical protein